MPAPSDPLMFPDFDHLPEFDELSNDLSLSNSIHGIPHDRFLDELDCKDDLKQLLIPELHAFGSALDDAEQAQIHSQKPEDIPFMSSFMNGSSHSMAFVSSSDVGLATSDGLSNGNLQSMREMRCAVSRGQAEHAEVSSPRTMIATHIMDGMSLEEMGLNSDDAFGTSAFSHLSPLGQPPTIRGLLTTPAPASPADMGAVQEQQTSIISPSVFESMSQVSSPSSTISTSDGSCTGGKGTTPKSVNSLLNSMLAHDDNFNNQFRNSSLGQPTELSPVSLCSWRLSPRADASGNCRGSIPPHVMQEVSHAPSMQRSHSSHALGQFRTPSHMGVCIEDFSLSPAPEMGISSPGLSHLGPYGQYQVSDSQGAAASSPIASMRRVYSTGDLQAYNGMQHYYGSNVPPEHSNVEDTGGLKIGHYTPEERKMKLHRYRQKRSERNFNKKIKYACRKTLAESRPRIRGRFARTDEIGESIPKENGALHEQEYEEGGRLLAVNDSFLMSNNNRDRCWNIRGMEAAM